MKGLILKDLYMTAKYCISYLFIVAVFIIISLFGSENFLFICYPCLFSGMIPATLLSYDERSKWSEYCKTMPYSQAQIVSAKYIIGIIFSFCAIILCGIAQAVKMNLNGSFRLHDYLALMTMLLILSSVTSVTLPFMFRFGVEKGRITYYFMIVIVIASGLAAQNIIAQSSEGSFSLYAVSPILCLAAIAIYALSWCLSIMFYKKHNSK